MSNSTCSHFCPQPLQKGLDAAQCQSWLILWFPARPFLVLQMFLPETAASFPPLTILSSCLPAEASKQVLPMQPPLQCTGDTHTSGPFPSSCGAHLPCNLPLISGSHPQFLSTLHVQLPLCSLYVTRDFQRNRINRDVHM